MVFIYLQHRLHTKRISITMPSNYSLLNSTMQ